MGQLPQIKFKNEDQILRFVVRREIDSGLQSFRGFTKRFVDIFHEVFPEERPMYFDSSDDSRALTANAKKLATYLGFDIDKHCVLKLFMVMPIVKALSPVNQKLYFYLRDRLYEGRFDCVEEDKTDHELMVALTVEAHEAVNAMVTITVDGRLDNDSPEDLDNLDRELKETIDAAGAVRTRIDEIRQERAAA